MFDDRAPRITSHMITSDALEAAELRVFGMRQLAQPFGILLDQLEKLHVPRRVVEAGALAVDLV